MDNDPQNDVCADPRCEHQRRFHSRLSGCLIEQGPGYCSCSEFVEGLAQAPEPTGAALADEGTARAYVTEADEWKADAEQALARLIQRGEPFTAEDLRLLVGRDPVHHNAMGSVFRTASRQGRIMQAGFVNAGRTSAHTRALRVWIPA